LRGPIEKEKNNFWWAWGNKNRINKKLRASRRKGARKKKEKPPPFDVVGKQ